MDKKYEAVYFMAAIYCIGAILFTLYSLQTIPLLIIVGIVFGTFLLISLGIIAQYLHFLIHEDGNDNEDEILVEEEIISEESSSKTV